VAKIFLVYMIVVKDKLEKKIMMEVIEHKVFLLILFYKKRKNLAKEEYLKIINLLKERI